MNEPRSLHELLHPTEDAWPLLQEWLASAGRPVEVVPADADAAAATLLALQVTTRSILGTLAYRTGGLMVDGGWLRVLGSGGQAIGGGLREWNEALGGRALEPPIARFMLVAYDAIGGFFAINGGAWPGDIGIVHYWTPDTLEWETLGIGHSEFVEWALSSSLDGFYDPYRWAGWRDEVAALGPDEGVSIYPPLGFRGPADTGEIDISKRTRAPVPASELWYFTHDLARQTAGLADGQSIEIRLDP